MYLKLLFLFLLITITVLGLSNPTLTKFNLFTVKKLVLFVQNLFIASTRFLPSYYLRNELLWVDGFLLDFLQKKSIDIWIRKFVIYSGFIFSERLVFDYVIKLYLDNIIWPLHYSSILEVNNTTEMLSITIFFYFFIFVLCCFFIFI